VLLRPWSVFNIAASEFTDSDYAVAECVMECDLGLPVLQTFDIADDMSEKKEASYGS